MKKLIAILMMAAMLLAMFAGCGQPAEGGKIKIAYVGPLTGDSALHLSKHCAILYQAFFAAGIYLWGLMPGASHDIKAGGPLPVRVTE